VVGQARNGARPTPRRTPCPCLPFPLYGSSAAEGAVADEQRAGCVGRARPPWFGPMLLGHPGCVAAGPARNPSRDMAQSTHLAHENLRPDRCRVAPVETEIATTNRCARRQAPPAGRTREQAGVRGRKGGDLASGRGDPQPGDANGRCSASPVPGRRPHGRRRLTRDGTIRKPAQT